MNLYRNGSIACEYVPLCCYRGLARHPQLREETNGMAEPLIKLSSVIEDELRAEIAEQKNEIARKDPEIRRLQELVNQLSSK